MTFIAIDHQWETVNFVVAKVFCFLDLALHKFLTYKLVFQDLPVDSTGELDHLRTFLEENRDVFEWVGIAVVIIQAYIIPHLLLTSYLSLRK